MDDYFLKKNYEYFTGLKEIKPPKVVRSLAFLLLAIFIIIIILLTFVPWIQTAPGKGTITALDPHDRAQNISSMVSGRIKKWYVNEGDRVKKGDPIIEIVDNDPNILLRLNAEKEALTYNLKAATIATETAKINYDRQASLYNDGLSSRLDAEKAKIKYKQYISKQEEVRAKVRQIESKISRQESQMLTAPRDGTIIDITSGNLATYVKAGDSIATLVPAGVEPAVQIYASGIDIALIYPGQKVRLQFEGWPTIQFSGWPAVSVGTFGGIVYSVDPFASKNGKFRVLIIPDHSMDPWPDNRFLHYGARVKGWVLLNKVALGYEIWRQLNAFPPEYTTKGRPKKEDEITFGSKKF